MSSIAKKLMMTAAGGEALAIEDVFSTYLYTGNGSTQTITNYIDLAGEGGLVWIKERTRSNTRHSLFDTVRGRGSWLSSDGDDSAQTVPVGKAITSFNSNGFSLGPSQFGTENSTGVELASWTFRKAPRFFDVVTYTGTGATQTINHGLDCDVGCIMIKRTDTTGNWQVGFPEQGSLDWIYGILELTNSMPAASYGQVFLGSKPTGTTVELIGDNTGWNESGGSYVMYLFAHDPLGPSGDGSDGLIACGSYTGNDSTNGPEINLGWEPQWCMIKNASNNANWVIHDNMRGWVNADGNNDARLFPNTSGGESTFATSEPNARGFKIKTTLSQFNTSGETYIYIAIRRGPMRAPTSGTEVFSAELPRSTAPLYLTTHTVDMVMNMKRLGDTHEIGDRLRGGAFLIPSSNGAETSEASYKFDYQNGVINSTADSPTWYVGQCFRRAPKFFDMVAYTGNGTAGRTVSHNLEVAPEMILVKNRSSLGGEDWKFGSSELPNAWLDHMSLNQTTLSGTNSFWNNTAPTETAFTVGFNNEVNGSGDTYIAYLFATLAGVSKVGSYTGNGTSQTINCGFTTGARFILIKRTDAAGDWYVWDTARGIVAGNDPFLKLNSTAAEVTTDDSIDPASSGFIVNQTAVTDVNVNAASYIFYAIA